jgi:superfamily II DNA or RNA helicase
MFTINESEQYTPAYVQDKIKNDQRWAESALVALYSYQEEDEKRQGFTKVINGVGFNGPDSSTLSYCAEWILKGHHLSGKFINQAIPKLAKYIKQLMRILQSTSGDGIIPPFGYDPGPISQTPPGPNAVTLKADDGQSGSPASGASAPVQSTKPAVPDDASLFDLIYKYAGITWKKFPNPISMFGASVNYQGEATSKFWEYWKADKDAVKAAGFILTKTPAGQWMVYVKNSVFSADTADKVDAFHSTPVDNTANIKFSSILKDWQEPVARAALKSLLMNKSVLDASGTGAGKTFIALAVLKAAELPFIVISPKPVLSQWEEVCEIFKLKPLLVINYEGIKTGKTKYYKSLPEGQENRSKSNMEWKVPAGTVIIFDEAHKTKNYKTANSKILIDAVNQGLSTYLMSATIGENPLKLYATGRALNLFRDEKEYFRWAFALGVQKGEWGGLEYKGSIDDMKKINQQIFGSGRGVQVPREVLTAKLPSEQRIVKIMKFDNQAKIEKVYEDLEAEFASIEDGEKQAKAMKNHLGIRIKARQKVELLKSADMIEMAEDFVEEGNSVVIVVNYSATIDYLSEKLKTKCIIDGRYTGQRDQNKKDFNEDKERIILVNIAAGGTGLSLHDTHGKYPRISLINPSDSAQELVQALGRIVRTGGASRCTQYILFAKNTVEEAIGNNVKKKVANINAINDGDLAAEFMADYNAKMREHTFKTKLKALEECLKFVKEIS